MKRRTALGYLGIGAAGTVLFPYPWLAAPDRLADLASRFRQASAGDLFDVAAAAIVEGADPNAILGASFLAGVHDVRPRPVGGNLHSVMLVESSYRLVEQATSPRQAWLIALWALDSFKRTQREERGEPWVLPPAPKVEFSSEAQARRELIAALDSWDHDRADRAVVGLLPFHDRESLYEILWPYTARSMAYLGHKIVYGAMTEAVLRRIDWKHAEPTLRSLVYGLVGRDRGDPLTRGFEQAVERAGSLPEGWLKAGKNVPESSGDMALRILKSDYIEAQEIVVAAFRAGLSTATVWDALRLGASELFRRRKSNRPQSGAAIRAAHPVTELWSLRIAWSNSRSEQTRRILILQAASWIAEMRDALLVRDAISMDGPGLAAPGGDGEHDESTLDAVFQSWRNEVASKGVEYHQFKCAVAIQDEAALADPRWASRLVASATGYMPTAADPDNSLTSRSLAALRKAGVPG